MGYLKPQMGPNSRVVPYQPPHKRASPAEMEDQRSKGLCFWCEEKYTFGHKCTNRRLHSLILEPMDEEEDLEEVEGVETADTDPIISLHALHRVRMSPKNHTMRLIGYYKKRKLHVLVNLGSTHNVLDVEMAKRIGCRLQPITQHKVMVANGDKLTCNSICSEFRWLMRGQLFEASVLLMPLKGCELILGMEWLNSLGLIKWDFPRMRMEFCIQGKVVILQSDNEHIWG